MSSEQTGPVTLQVALGLMRDCPTVYLITVNSVTYTFVTEVPSALA